MMIVRRYMNRMIVEFVERLNDDKKIEQDKIIEIYAERYIGV